MVLGCGMVSSFNGFAAWASLGVAIFVKVPAHDTGSLVYLMVKLLLCVLLGIDLNHGMRVLAFFNKTIAINTIGNRPGRSSLESHKEIGVPSRGLHDSNNRSGANDISVSRPGIVLARLRCHSQVHPRSPAHAHPGTKWCE